MAIHHVEKTGISRPDGIALQRSIQSRISLGSQLAIHRRRKRRKFVGMMTQQDPHAPHEERTRVDPEVNSQQDAPGKLDSSPDSEGQEHRKDRSRSCCFPIALYQDPAAVLRDYMRATPQSQSCTRCVFRGEERLE